MVKKEKEGNDHPLKHLLILSISAVGVVYGDIGTSPLYALRECFHGSHAIEINSANILGVLSLIFWSLILIISFKYLIIIMRADNSGEGGILALMQLVLPKKNNRKRMIIFSIGLFGAALLYGDGIITPAISVLSAIEGLEVATPFFKPYIVPITIIILLLLFLFQKKGTGNVGLIFGPVMLVWFIVLAILGGISIFGNPKILAAVNPYYAYVFFTTSGWQSVYVLGAVFLVVTGGEALYADMGHFGKKPIRLVWFTLVLPCLLINYFGQGALLLKNNAMAENPFYHLVPDWGLYPMVILATFATVIASQAVISGAFSLTFQALQLGYLPRLGIIHTSEEEAGQVYIPQINWILFVATIGVVLGFQSSSNLAAAYGVAVTTTMVITSLLAFVAMRKLWKWNLAFALLLTSFFLIIDLSFFGSNVLKILQGGWFPILVGLFIFLLMTTWIKGRKLITERLQQHTEAMKDFIQQFNRKDIHNVEGTAIYLTDNLFSTPPALMHNIKHNKVIHHKVIFLNVGFKNKPHIPKEERITCEELFDNFYRILVKYGYKDRSNLEVIIQDIIKNHTEFDLEKTTFFLGHETLLPDKNRGMSIWRDQLYIFLAKSAQGATRYFNLPTDKVFEIGEQIVV